MKDSMHPGRRDRRVLRHQSLLAAVNARPELDTQEIKQTAPVERFSVTEESTSLLKSSESI
jgi:hypothetical protein